MCLNLPSQATVRSATPLQDDASPGPLHDRWTCVLWGPSPLPARPGRVHDPWRSAQTGLDVTCRWTVSRVSAQMCRGQGTTFGRSRGYAGAAGDVRILHRTRRDELQGVDEARTRAASLTVVRPSWPRSPPAVIMPTAGRSMMPAPGVTSRSSGGRAASRREVWRLAHASPPPQRVGAGARSVSGDGHTTSPSRRLPCRISRNDPVRGHPVGHRERGGRRDVPLRVGDAVIDDPRRRYGVRSPVHGGWWPGRLQFPHRMDQV